MLSTQSSLLNINHQSSKSYNTALSFAHKVACLATQSELNFPISLICLKLTKTKTDSLYIHLGIRTVLVLGTGTVLVLGTGTVIVLGTGTVLNLGTGTVLVLGTGTVLVLGTGTVLVLGTQTVLILGIGTSFCSSCAGTFLPVLTYLSNTKASHNKTHYIITHATISILSLKYTNSKLALVLSLLN